MKAPDKIYIQTNAGETFSSKWTTIPFRDFENTEYIRKDVVDETIKTAEDHAYFAGQEKLREKLMEWAKEKYEEYDRRIAGFPDDGAYWGQRNAFRQMIDKLNSM